MKKKFIILFFMICTTFVVFSQDTIKTIQSSSISAEQFKADTLAKQENSPLDIANDRGLYILTKDGKMQLRILGSVRFAVLYDFVELPVKGTFNTYYIPTGDDNTKVPNYYNDLRQTRIGFEVNRKLDKKNVFIRLESDFNGQNGQFRIRHAYGEVGKFLVGQTWSLFSNVSSLPAMVDGNGPTGSVTLRTAQARYSGKNNKGVRWAAALEYSKPDINFQDFDTSGLSSVQLIPDVTGRIEYDDRFGAVQLSAVFTTISVKDLNNNVTNSFGLGGSLSGTIEFDKTHKLLYQITYGKSISHFITTFSRTGNDALYNPETGKIESTNSFGGFLSYGLALARNLSTNISAGYAELGNKNFQPVDAFKNSMSLSIDGFWSLAEGAKVGVEYVFGQRWNKDGSSGNASRISALFYYDF